MNEHHFLLMFAMLGWIFFAIAVWFLVGEIHDSRDNLDGWRREREEAAARLKHANRVWRHRISILLAMKDPEEPKSR